jgi:hypothetical protein
MWRCECGEGISEVDNRIMRVQLMLSLHNSGSDVEVRWGDFDGSNSTSRLRRIRDKLVSEDRFVMALDLSTKCQLECASVWADWARALVAMGQCVAATHAVYFSARMTCCRYEAAFEKLRGWASADGWHAKPNADGTKKMQKGALIVF